MPDPRYFRFGADGPHVLRLQTALRDAGYDLAVDGDFGKETATALIQYERDHGFFGGLSMVPDQRTLQHLLTPKPWRPHPKLPVGRGMAIRSLSKRHVGTPEQFADRLSYARIMWVQVHRLWQKPNPADDIFYNAVDDKIRPSLEVLRDRNAAVWITGWPQPGRDNDFLAVMQKYAAELGGEGLRVPGQILNAEDQFAGRHLEADTLAQAALGSELPASGLSSYGGPWNFPTFPFAAFSILDFVNNQVYDLHNKADADYPTRSVLAYRDLGFERVIPTSPLFGKTQSQLEQLLGWTPTPENAIKFWDWFNAHKGMPGWKWDVIKDMVLEPGPV